MSDPERGASEEERVSLDLVQRLVMSAIVWVVFGFISAGLSLYLIFRGESDLGRDRSIGLWIMSGVVGLVAAVATLVINRRKPWNPLVLPGLLPMAISAYWVL